VTPPPFGSSRGLQTPAADVPIDHAAAAASPCAVAVPRGRSAKTMLILGGWRASREEPQRDVFDTFIDAI